MYVRELFTRPFEKHADYIFSSTFATDAAVCVCGEGNCDISSDTPRNSLLSSLSLRGQGGLRWLDAGGCLYYCFGLQAVHLLLAQSTEEEAFQRREE